MNVTQESAIRYYDRFAKVYDLVSSDRYYHKPRTFAIEALGLKEGQTVLNLPCGTGQNFKYFQKYLNGTGQIIGIDLSDGMLEKALEKKKKHNWKNIVINKRDATKVNLNWIKKEFSSSVKIDAILLDLGLSGFPEWENVIDNMITLLKPNGRIVIMDWYIKKPTLRGKFIEWIGKGEVNRNIGEYLKPRVANYNMDDSFKGGDMFVASGNKKSI